MLIKKGNKQKMIDQVKDAIYIVDYLDEQEQNKLVQTIKSFPWSKKISRKTQHYGYEYDYKSRSLSKTYPIPSSLEREGFDQLIVNHYLKGQSIAPHIDHPKLFDNEIHIISLCDNAKMNIGNVKLELIKGSLLILKDDSRYKMKHSLKYEGNSERISLTYRTTT